MSIGSITKGIPYIGVTLLHFFYHGANILCVLEILHTIDLDLRLSFTIFNKCTQGKPHCTAIVLKNTLSSFEVKYHVPTSTASFFRMAPCLSGYSSFCMLYCIHEAGGYIYIYMFGAAAT